MLSTHFSLVSLNTCSRFSNFSEVDAVYWLCSIQEWRLITGKDPPASNISTTTEAAIPCKEHPNLPESNTIPRRNQAQKATFLVHSWHGCNTMANLNCTFYQLTLQYFTKYQDNHLIQCDFTDHSTQTGDQPARHQRRSLTKLKEGLWQYPQNIKDHVYGTAWNVRQAEHKHWRENVPNIVAKISLISKDDSSQ